MEENREYKVYYSFLHKNEHPYKADEYRVYRQDGVASDYSLINTLDASLFTETVDSEDGAVKVTGIDVVNDCGVVY